MRTADACPPPAWSPVRGSSAVVATPAPPDQWLELAAGADVLPTQTPQWLACVGAERGWQDRSRLYQLAGGRRLLLPLVGRGVGTASVLASWPYGWGYGGLLCSDGEPSTEECELVARDLAGQHALRTSVVPSPFASAWPVAAGSRRTPYLTHALDLSGGRDALWRGYSANVRRSVRRAERSGIEVHRDQTGALLPAFARLHRASVDRWAAQDSRPLVLARLAARVTEPAHRLDRLARAHGPALTVWAAFLRGEPVAAIVVLRGRSTVLYWRGAMDRELAGRTHANALLHHLALEEAVSDGARTYSFGESDEGSPLADYKAKFGARPHRWYAVHEERVPVTAVVGALRTAYTHIGRVRAARSGRQA